jgi:phage protein D
MPAVSVLANGTLVEGVVDVEVSSDSFMGANRYRLSVALDASGYDVWAGNAIDLQISMGLDGNWQSLIIGPVDRVRIDVGARLIHVEGRDLTARFIEARTQETFENRTSSEVATLLAQRRGLAANIVSTSSLVGRDFGGDHAGITLDQYCSVTTEWDLLAKLADAEGFDVWVEGETLNFAPPLASQTATIITPYDCVAVQLERVTTLCGDLQVSVKSWDCRGQQAISQKAGAATNGNTSREYVLIRPNLTAAAAADLANRTLTQMTQNARVVTLEMAGDLTANPRQTLQLADTGTDFDGIYILTSVERRLSFDHGFSQTLQARTPPWTTF